MTVNPMKISVFENLNDVTQKGHVVDVDKVLDRIATGSRGLSKQIKAIRKETNAHRYKRLKEKLPQLLFSGQFTIPVDKINRRTGLQYVSYRDDESLETHSGLIVIDLDHLGKDMDEVKEFFSLDPHVYAFFVSPGGDGLKVVYRIPADKATHRDSFRAISSYLEKEGIYADASGVNESRLCFISYDPDMYHNPDAEVFTKQEKLTLKDERADGKILHGDGLTDYRKMAIVARMIDEAQDGEKHHTLVKAAYLMGGFVASGFADEEEARNILRTRIKNKPGVVDLKKAYNTIDDSLEAGKRMPIQERTEMERTIKNKLKKQDLEDPDRLFSFLEDPRDMNAKFWQYHRNGVPQGKKLGVEELDPHFALHENSFSIFMGHDNVGKSFFVWWVAVCAALAHGWKWLIYSPENDPVRIKKHMVEMVLGVKIDVASKENIQTALRFVDEYFFFVRQDTLYTVFQLLEFGKVVCDNDPDIKGFLLDPYNSLIMDYKGKGKGLSSYEYHHLAASEIRLFAKEYCSVFLNAHSNTDSRRVVKRDAEGRIPRPHKQDITGGAMWADRCDEFYVIHRQIFVKDEYNKTLIYTEKVKDLEAGTRATRGDEVVSMELTGGGFVGEESRDNPLKKLRGLLFEEDED